MGQPLKTIDALIVAGELKKARKLLHEQGRAGAFKTNRLEFARLARRLDLPMTGLRILHSVMHASSRRVAPDDIRCEYAAALNLVGASGEAERILSTVTEGGSPEILLFKSFNRISQWDYAGAATYLRRYVEAPGLTDYQRMIGQANLIAALIYERDPEARSLVDRMIELATSTQYTRILGYLLLRKGELEVTEQRWEPAYRVLAEALRIAKEESMDRFLIRKWSTIVSLYSHEERKSLSLYELAELRREAEEHREWETVRSLDYHRARAMGDQRLFQHVYFGTPHSSFRELLLIDSPELKSSTEIVWTPDGGAPARELCLEKGWPGMRVGGLTHRLLLALSLDFYRPTKMAELFTRLFPGEVFNVDSSPVRVRKAVERAREGLAASRSGVRVAISRGMYSLALPAGLGLRVTIDRSPTSKLKMLEADFGGGKVFSLAEARERMGTSLSTAQRQVRAWCESGKLARNGRGRLTRYAIK